MLLGNAWFHKKWSGPRRRVELDPEPPVKSGRPAPAFRLSRREPKSATGHAHGPSDSGTRRFSIGSKDRRVQHLRCRPTPKFILAKPARRRERTACKSFARHTLHFDEVGTTSAVGVLSYSLGQPSVFMPLPTQARHQSVLHIVAGITHPEAAPDQSGDAFGGPDGRIESVGGRPLR